MQPRNQMISSWKERYDKPRQCIKSKDIILQVNICRARTMVFPVVMHGCESCPIKKAECQRIVSFKPCCWRRLVRVPWRSNQSSLKEINPEYSLEGLMLKLKLQYFGHLMRRTDSGKDPDVGKDRRQEEKGMRWLYGITDSTDMSLS